MERIEKDTAAEVASTLRDDRIEAAIDSLTQLESYYQSKYEYYLAMATEAKENKERVGLLLLDLDRDVLNTEDRSIGSSLTDRQGNNGAVSHQSLDKLRVNLELPQAKPEIESSPPAVIDEEKQASSSAVRKSDLKSDCAPSARLSRVEQMKRWTLDLFKAMTVIESVSSSDSGKALHQNYLHHLINRELNIELSSELVELYLEEAIRRGYLEPDEFNNDCYIAKPTNDSKNESFDKQNENIATDKATDRKQLLGRETAKPYDLPDSDKLKPTLFETLEGYIKKNRPKHFSIEDVVNYLYPQPVQSEWNKVQRNKVRTSISNALSRKAYLGKHWSRIKPGIYRPKV